MGASWFLQADLDVNSVFPRFCCVGWRICFKLGRFVPNWTKKARKKIEFPDFRLKKLGTWLARIRRNIRAVCFEVPTLWRIFHTASQKVLVKSFNPVAVPNSDRAFFWFIQCNESFENNCYAIDCFILGHFNNRCCHIRTSGGSIL